jgi:hypothetical protein
MHGFLIRVGPAASAPSDLAGPTQAVTLLHRGIGVDLATEGGTRSVREGAWRLDWSTFVPVGWEGDTARGVSPLLAWHETDSRMVFTWGRCFESSDDLASVIASSPHPTLIDGSFAACQVDLASGRVEAFGDAIGRRTLRLVADGDRVFVATHDLLLAAAGVPADLDLDLASLASSLGIDFSLGAVPFLSGVEVTRPDAVWVAADGRVSHRRAAPFPIEDRLDPRDRRGRDAQLERMVELAQRAAQRGLGPRLPIRADLTAGVDSRATLAAVVATADRDRVTCVTNGAPESLEVQVATQVATRAGLPIERVELGGCDVPTFERNLRLLSWAMNGDTDGRRGLQPALTFPSTAAKAHGGGGGIFKGKYYGGLTDALRPPSVTAAADRLRAELSRKLTGAAGVAPDWSARAVDRLPLLLDAAVAGAQTGFDVLDLAFLWGRTRVWEAMLQRFWWTDPAASIFDSPGLVRAGYRLPAPVSQDWGLHRALIARFLPAASRVPVNSRFLLPLAGHSPARTVAGWITQIAGGPAALAQRRRKSAPSFTADARRAESLRGILRSGWLEGRRLPPVGDPDPLTSAVAAHRDGHRNHTAWLGKLLAAQQFIDDCRAVRREAAHVAAG